MRQLERMCARVPADAPDLAPNASEWDAGTLEGWLRRSVRTRDARDMLAMIAGLKLAAEPGEVSLLCFLHFVRASGGLVAYEEFAESGAQEERLVGGAQVLCAKLEALLAPRVCLGEAVNAIGQCDSRGVTVHTILRTISARRAVLAMAPALAGRIAFSPELPRRRAKLQRRASMGPIIKCALAYDAPFWRAAGYSGEAYSVAGPVRAVVDDCSADGAYAGLAAFVVGDQARQLSALGADQRRALIVAEVARLLGAPAREPIAFVEKDWAADEWSRGCVSFFGPGVLAECHGALREPVGRVHFAGTEAATEWQGHLEGAVESGMRAAAEVLARLQVPLVEGDFRSSRPRAEAGE
jgi:monoamine oxidase